MPSRNRLGRIAPVVHAYLEQGADEIVVVLDGPHPGWREALDEVRSLPRVRIEQLPANLGLALARVAGLGFATGDIILIADDDVSPGLGLVDRHRQFHARNPKHALVGYMPVKLPLRRTQDQAATYVYARDYHQQVARWRTAESEEILGSFWTGNASVPRACYLAAESYMPSEKLNYNEDLDLGLRLREIGVRGAFDEEAMALHEHRRDFASFRRECIVRGEAVSALKARWPALPGQLGSLVQIPASHSLLVASIQRWIGRRNRSGPIEYMTGLLYRICGILHAWPVQDAIARFERRALAIRGYRLAEERRNT